MYIESITSYSSTVMQQLDQDASATLTSAAALVAISTRVSEELSQKTPSVLSGLCAKSNGTEP